METYCEEDHIITDTITITFKPDYQRKTQISVKNISIDFPDVKTQNMLSNYANLISKAMYPGQRHENTYYTTGTRVYYCSTITNSQSYLSIWKIPTVAAMTVNHKKVHSQLLKLKKLTINKTNLTKWRRNTKQYNPGNSTKNRKTTRNTTRTTRNIGTNRRKTTI